MAATMTDRHERAAFRASEDRLPPGQYLHHGWPVLHYGPIPEYQSVEWDLCVYGATATERRWTLADLERLDRSTVLADMHCVTKFTVPSLEWSGFAAATVAKAAPPSPEATHVM